MNITTFTSIPIKPAKLAFEGDKKPENKKVFVDRGTQVRASTGGFIANILATGLIVPSLVKKILGNPTTLEALQAVPQAKKAMAVITGLATVLAATFAGVKFAANRGKVEEEKLSNKTLMKFTLASMVGTAIGSLAGNTIAAKAGGNFAGFIAQVILPILSNDMAVNLTASNHNKNAFKPTINVIQTPEGPVVVRDFRDFVQKAGH